MISPELQAWIDEKTGIKIIPESARSVSGGCIHHATLVDRADGGFVFVKQNQRNQLDLFETEARSLEWIRATQTIRAPEPFATGVVDEKAVLILEGIILEDQASAAAQQRLAHELSALHQHSSPEDRWGAPNDNYIGATPQPNPWTDSWSDFFVEHRLEFQFKLAEARCRTFSRARALIAAAHRYLDSFSVTPKLVHGDLWGGNVSFDTDGHPVIFDPASYYGDPETDLAFTTLFGGFGEAFYSAYWEHRERPEPVRFSLYNLYHLLNHYNLFGGSYASQAEASIKDILHVLT
ncbi:MAG: fructosamine kinase family protein [Verrucomicrobiota bacterium]